MSAATTRSKPPTQPHAKPSVIIIGAGMAGTRFAMGYAKACLEREDKDFKITLINSEPHAGYNRIMLSPVLAGEKAFDEIFLYPQAEYDHHHICLKTGCSVTDIDTQHQTLTTDTGETLGYDKLVFATGSTPFILPLPNNDAHGVLAFRTKADVDKMLDLVKNTSEKSSVNCVVIGGGFLGLEAANALANHGAKVTVVHSSDYLLNRQLDITAAQLLQQHFEKKGIKFMLNAKSQAITVNNKNQVTGLMVETNGKAHTILADCVIMTVGVRPNIELAKKSGIACERGILVDSQMRTHTPNVYAIGECVQFDNQLFGLVAPVYEQAAILIHTLENDSTVKITSQPMPEQHFSVKPTATKLKVSGVDLFSAGKIEPEPDCEELLYHDPAHAIYQKLTLKNNRLKSAVLYGDVGDGAWFFELIQTQQNIEPIKDKLLFGQAFCQDFC